MASCSSLALAAAIASALVSAPSAERAGPRGDIRGQVDLVRLSVGSSVSGFDQVVVYLLDAPNDRPMPGGPFIMRQSHKRFEPSLLIVPAGAQVRFPNGDPIFHNVFSLSPGNRFDLGLYKGGHEAQVPLERPGVVAVYCNIHPQMVAHIVVLSNPYFARPDAGGRFTLKGVPPGLHRIAAWFPFGKAAEGSVEVGGGHAATVTLTLRERPGALLHDDKEGRPYGRY